MLPCYKKVHKIKCIRKHYIEKRAEKMANSFEKLKLVQWYGYMVLHRGVHRVNVYQTEACIQKACLNLFLIESLHQSSSMV